MHIHSKEKPVLNHSRLSVKGVNILMPMVDQMVKLSLYRAEYVKKVVCRSFAGDFKGLLTQAGATRDYLMFHEYANKHIDTRLFDGVIEDGIIYILNEDILDKIKIRA